MESSWKDVFVSLPDAAFFEVVRNYLGPVRTPFHKPDLVGRTAEFFSQDSVRERVLSFIDPEDSRILTIVAFHGASSEETLRDFSLHLRPSAILEKLLNLEERLLIFKKTPGKEYALTPLGREVLHAGLIGPGTIAGAGAEGTVPEAKLWFNDNFLTSALAFLSERIPLFRKEGGWRKKSLETLMTRFPSLFRDDRGEDRLLLAGRGFLAAGMADRSEEILIPRLDAWREMESRSPDDRLTFLKARAACGRSIPVSAAAAGVRMVTEFLPKDRFFEPKKLANLFRLAVGSESSCSPQGAQKVIAHLELLGELVSDERGRLARPYVRNESTDRPKMTITPVGDLTLNPGMPLSCNLALAAEPVNSDVVATFRITKNRFLDGLDRGIDSKRLFSEIETHTGRSVPENIRTLSEEWIKEHSSTGLILAAVFRAEGIMEQIVTETGILEPYSLSIPAPGLWILDPAFEGEWRSALASVGVERIPPLKTPSGSILPVRGNREADTAAALPSSSLFSTPALAGYSWKDPKTIDIDEILEELRLKAEKAGLSPEEKEIFEERLLRRLLLVPEQIRPEAWRYEVMSAKGLDYRGKIRLAEAAISGRNDRLEVTHAVGNSVQTDLIIPKKLEKEGDDHILSGLSVSDEQEVRFKIRKIGFLKRIKTTLF